MHLLQYRLVRLKADAERGTPPRGAPPASFALTCHGPVTMLYTKVPLYVLAQELLSAVIDTPGAAV